MLKKNIYYKTILAFSFGGAIMFFHGIGDGLNHDWWKMILYYCVFIYLLFYLILVILNYKIEIYFKQLESFILDENKEPEIKNKNIIEHLLLIGIVLLQAICLISAIVFGVRQNWFWSGLFLVINTIIIFTCASILITGKINFLKNNLMKQISDNREKLKEA